MSWTMVKEADGTCRIFKGEMRKNFWKVQVNAQKRSDEKAL